MKRLIATIIICALFASLTPVPTAQGSSTPVEYVRSIPQYPVMNAQTYTRTNFINEFVGSDNDSIYNIAPAFTKQSQSEGASSMPNNLTFGTTFKHKNDDNTYAMYYEYNFETVMVPALKKGDLHVSFIANLTNDRHWNIDRHLSTKTAYPVTWLRTYEDAELIVHTTKDHSRDGTWTMGKNTFVPIPARSYEEKLWFRAFAQVCTCGSSKVSNISIMLADVVGPAVKSITTTGIRNGVVLERLSEFKGGDTVLLHLKFDEPIRFALDQAMTKESAPKLKLQLKRVADNLVETRFPTEASLISLNNDTLTFEYVVPTEIAIEHYIDSVAPYLEQSSWVSATDAFDLKLFGKQSASSPYINYSYKTTSLIVDLAGNPIDPGHSVRSLGRSIRLDSTPPIVTKFDLSRAFATEPEGDLSRRDIFAGADDYIDFSATFSEHLYVLRHSDNTIISLSEYGLSDLVAEINLTKGDGPIKLTAINVQSEWDSSKSYDSVYFSTSENLAGAAPIKYNDLDLPIGINRIYLAKEGYTLCDRLGNPYDNTRQFINVPSRLMPRRELWLDVHGPSITTALPYNGIAYLPMGYEDNDPSAFYFPISITDSLGDGEKYRSLTLGCMAKFAWLPSYGSGANYSFEYAVTGSNEKPDGINYKYRQASMGQYLAFPPLDSGNYIHIRLLDGAEFKDGTEIRVIANDNAENYATEQFPIEFNLDRVAPLIFQGNVTKKVEGGAGRLRAEIYVEDHSQNLNIEYQWTSLGSAPTGAWTTISAYETINIPNYTLKYHRFTVERTVAVDENFRGSLHVRVTDEGGNIATARFDHEYYLTRPTVDIDFVTNPSIPNEKHTIKLLPPTRGKDQGAAHQVIVLIYRERIQSTDIYWYKDFFWFDSAGGLLSNEAIDLFSPENTTGWECVFPVDYGEFGLVYFPAAIHYDNYHPDIKPIYDSYIEDLFKQYGKIQATVIGRDYSSSNDSSNSIRFGEVISQHKFDVYFASDDLLGENAKIHNITITPLSPTSNQEFTLPAEVLTTIPANLAMPASLDGTAFRVTLEPLLFNKAYGLTDIDFTSPDTRFALYKTGPGAPTEPVYTAPLVAKSAQDIVIPAGVATESGSYKVVVTVKAKGSGRIDRCEYTNINVDCRVVDAYGVSKATTQHTINTETLVFCTDHSVTPGSRVTELYLSAANVDSQTLRFSANMTPLSYGTESHFASYIKVWNVTASSFIPKSSYNWLYFPAERDFSTSVLKTETDRDTIINSLASGNASTASVIPLLPGENLIEYEIMLANGRTTREQTILVVASDANPTIEMSLSFRAEDGATNNNVTASIFSLSSPVLPPEGLAFGLLGATPEQAHKLNTERSLELSNNGEYTFYTYDLFHNIGIHTVTIDFIDKAPPSIVVENNTTANSSSFSLDVTISDNFGADSSRLFFTYDAEYLSLLGLPADSIFNVPENTSWQATQVSPNGLFATTCKLSSTVKTFTIQGAFKHDPLNGAATANRTLTLYALDGVGNKSAEHSITFTAANKPAQYTTGMLADGGFKGTFSQPVMLSTPAENTTRPSYSLTKQLPFHSDGIYPVVFSDLFGTIHNGIVEVNHYTALYNHTVSVSQLAPTNENVQVFINAAFNTGLTIELPDSILGASIETITDGLGNKVGATITMTQNGTISFVLIPKDLSSPPLERKIAINNIDKTTPSVSLAWVYTAPVVDGETSGEVTVSLDADEDILPLLGTGTTHTFRCDDQEPYTFHYTDLAGNSGSITAALPVTIIEKALTPDDNTPPCYTLAIYANNTKIKGYTQEDYEALADKSTAIPLFSGVLQLRFTIDDENQTNLSVQNLSSTTPSAVQVSGATVTVSTNAEFTVVITDTAGNMTEVPFDITSADNTPPRGTIIYEKIGPYIVRAYLDLDLTDDPPGTVSLRNTEGAKLESEGPHAGKYYYDFYDNGSFIFRFADAAGNLGSTVASVTTLDMSSPLGTIIEWSPYYVDGEGNAHKHHLASTPTNSNVSVYIRFNKPVRSITPSIINDISSLSDIELTHTADTAIVVFKNNAEARLRFDALNGKMGEMVLSVDIIDKTPPVITATPTTANSRFVTYTFSANEPVILEDAENKGVAATSFSRTYYLNGDYTLKFTDLAGNCTLFTINVAGIDRTAPEISIVGLPATKEVIEAYNLANGTALQHMLIFGPLDIHVYLNEAGTIRFGGKSYQVNPSEPLHLSINANGSYGLEATDLVGNSTTFQFRVDCLDQTPPKISLQTDLLVLRQGITLLEYEQKVLEQATVTDNFDPSPTLKLSESSEPIEARLNTPGTFRVSLEAIDQAGNIGYASLYIRITDPRLPEIQVNSSLAQPNETIFVSGSGSRQIRVAIDNLGNEPYTMYWKSGINTPGQMKNAQTFSTSFTAPRDGFYTVYIMTQSKASYTVYVYLQS